MAIQVQKIVEASQNMNQRLAEYASADEVYQAKQSAADQAEAAMQSAKKTALTAVAELQALLADVQGRNEPAPETTELLK